MKAVGAFTFTFQYQAVLNHCALHEVNPGDNRWLQTGDRWLQAVGWKNPYSRDSLAMGQ